MEVNSLPVRSLSRSRGSSRDRNAVSDRFRAKGADPLVVPWGHIRADQPRVRLR
jgi:hypothetical protein